MSSDTIRCKYLAYTEGEEMGILRQLPESKNLPDLTLEDLLKASNREKNVERTLWDLTITEDEVLIRKVRRGQ
jgi:hypothetical protein